jgi:hypothetical protein
LDTPPPGAGSETWMDWTPAVPRVAAGATTVSCVELTKVAANTAPFHETAEELSKPVPMMVNFASGLPAETLAGETELTVGTGLPICTFSPADVPPPGAGFETVIDSDPEAARSAAVSATVT